MTHTGHTDLYHLLWLQMTWDSPALLRMNPANDFIRFWSTGMDLCQVMTDLEYSKEGTWVL